jgi:hypothetical protein
MADLEEAIQVARQVVAVTLDDNHGQDPSNHPDQKEISSVVDKLHKLPLGRVATGSDGIV